MNPKESVADFFDRFKDYENFSFENLPDKEISAAFFNAVKQTVPSIVTANLLSKIGNKEMRINDMKFYLLQNEAENRDVTTEISSGATAQMAHPVNNQRYGDTCFRCGQKGHLNDGNCPLTRNNQ